MRLNDTTRTYFEKLSTVATPEEAARYRGLLDPQKAPAIREYLAENDPGTYSMLHTSISPNIITAGYQINVIPSEAEATLDIRAARRDLGYAPRVSTALGIELLAEWWRVGRP